MGQHGGWAPPGGLQPNGLLSTEAAGVTRVLDEERWSLAEGRTAELIACIQPNRPSEERRNAVADYVRRLIMNCFPCQVCTFGSVPLKTYLPDGDIDLTAFSKNEDLKDKWAITVRDVLQNEEKNENAEFHVKEVQYIQAEVKIVKCLVENIVVDISFNQVGGLCTLCFLEEIDHLINHNHLFKRSIILIKAWCYYESRILGAHHGLISTYALETLVLYIFHVFNNSFAGPLEVLFRFLEFFSNFDWDKFCVSLWGPVPVNSLPDMIAEPPRKDGGALLLSKGFLDSCSMAYAVFPGGQESQGQSFLSKHFNVIDPLRVNNNLGRSVSKGNFFRIRSAFSFGAKRLAKLVHCPKENLIAELNQFFMNTWERHGSGNRPDAPSPRLSHLQPSKTVSHEEPNNSRSTSSNKRNNERVGPSTGHEYQVEAGIAFQARTSQIFKNIRQQSTNVGKTSAPSVSYTPIQKNISNPSNSRASDKIERTTSLRVSSQAEKNQKNSGPVYPLNDLGGQARFQFARTHSSPELIDSSSEVSFGGSQNKVAGTGKDQIALAKSEYGFARKESSYEASGCHSGISSDDPSSLRQISPHKSLRSSDLDSVSSDYQDVGFTTAGGDLSSVAEAIELQQEMDQEQQDLINLGASPSGHNFAAPVQVPIHFRAPHLPIPLPPSLASLGCAQRNLAGIYPTSFPLIDPAWAPKFDLSHAFISPQFSHSYPTSTLSSNSEEVESGNESCSVPEVNHEDNDHFWHEQVVASNIRFELETGGYHRIHPDDQKQANLGFLDSLSSLQLSNSGAPFMRGHQKFAKEDKESPTDDFTAFRHQTSRSSENNANERAGISRFVPVHQPGSSRNKPASENSWDGSSIKVSKSARDRRGRKPSVDTASLHGKTKSGWQHDDSSDLFSAQADDEASPRARTHQSPGYEPVEVAGSNPVIPISQLVVNSSQQKLANNTGVVPFAFYPTGPPVPFLTMLPVYNFPPEAGNSNGPTGHLDGDEGLEHGDVNSCGQNFDSGENLDQFEAHLVSSALSTAPMPTEEHKADILNSDFASHWQSLQYGRSCQNTRQQGPPLIYSSNAVPPLYLQGNFPWDGPGRPFSANGNVVTQIANYGHRLVPVTALQPGPRRNSGVQRFADEIPRYRRGTGTYLPNPKLSFRDRQSSNTRSHRGNQNFDQNDRPDRERSWVNSKSRSGGRSYGRPQAEKPSLQPDRLSATDNRSDRSWNSYRHEPIASYNSHNSSFRSNNSSNSSTSVAYGMYPLPALNANGASPTGPALPSVVMLYPYNQGVGYGSPAEPLEFGSIGPGSLSNMNEVHPNDGVSVRGAYDQRQNTYFGGSSRSSPDRASSPPIPRTR